MMNRIWRGKLLVLTLSVLSLLISSGPCLADENGVSEMQKAYVAFQMDADVVRLRHLVYYGKLIEEFKEKTGSYPFQGEAEVPVYVHLASPDQQRFVRGGPNAPHEVRTMKEFVRVLEEGLERELDEHYDPQRRPDVKPNFYIYMVTGTNYFFAVHQYQAHPFAKNVRKGYNKVEVSSAPNDRNQAKDPDTLFASQEFIDALNAPVKKEAFFDARTAQLLHASKVKPSVK